MTAVLEPRSRRAPVTYQELLDDDSRPVPAVLRRQSPLAGGPTYVPVERYTSEEFFKLEVDKLWRKVWQMACREEDIAEVGDSITYDIAGLSVLVVRSAPERFQAFHNVCLHRGRRLSDHGTHCSRDFRCPFHGFAWHLDGTLKQVPSAWDFPHVTPEAFGLPEVRVGRWGGFVFINLDPHCGSLEDHLGELPDHFSRWPLEDRYKQAHVAKVLRCNWKLAQEAFMEAYHVVATHPQLLPGMGDSNSQYDVFGNFSRAITPNGTPSPHLAWEPTEQQMLDAMTDRNLDEPFAARVGPGETARRVAAANRRRLLAGALGEAAEGLTDAEMVDNFYFTVFPNFHPWGSYNRIVYRFRPYGTDVRRSVMECLFLSPFVGERPKAAPIHWLGEDDDWTEAPELALLARVFNQDVFNLQAVQSGLDGFPNPTITFANYQETKLRHFHQLLEQQLAR